MLLSHLPRPAMDTWQQEPGLPLQVNVGDGVQRGEQSLHVLRLELRGLRDLLGEVVARDVRRLELSGLRDILGDVVARDVLGLELRGLPRSTPQHCQGVR